MSDLLKCSNCNKPLAPYCVFCPACLDLYYKGVEVQGRAGKIQNFEGPPKGYVSPNVPTQLDFLEKL